jgi:probable rRNA maturation factor
MTKTPDKNITSDITVNINVSCDIVRFDRRKMTAMARETTRRLGVKKAQINLVVVNDDEIIGLNRRFLGRNNSTDVISFDLSDNKDDTRFFDIAVNVKMAQRQGQAENRSSESELALYFLHGLLHNLGFDDTSSVKAAKMHKIEDDILKKSGYGIVYNQKK